MIRKSGNVTTTVKKPISSKLKVKVFKSEPDNLRRLCGEEVQIDDEGNEYFVIPSCFGELMSKQYPRYSVGEEFLPQADIDSLAKPEAKSIIEEKKEAEKKKRGNPNWGKKKDVEEEEDSEDASDENG